MRIEQRYKEKNKNITIDVIFKHKNGKVIKVERIKFKPTDIIEGDHFKIVKRKTSHHEVIRRKLGDSITIKFINIYGHIMEFDIWENLFLIKMEDRIHSSERK